jgi:NAD(P)-dependent dehydrogenase (short-subunit alcohol dehydrogenase family)
MARTRRVAVVTGANRRIGFAICRQLARRGYAVILTARDPVNGPAAARLPVDEGLDVTFGRLDVTASARIKRFARHPRTKVGRPHVLVNNAGIYLEGGHVDDHRPESVFHESIDKVRLTMQTNLCAPYPLRQAFVPLMLVEADRHGAKNDIPLTNSESDGKDTSTKIVGTFIHGAVATGHFMEDSAVWRGA